MADLETDPVSALYLNLVKAEVNDIVIAVAMFNRNFLAVEQCIIEPYLDSNAVRP